MTAFTQMREGKAGRGGPPPGGRALNEAEMAERLAVPGTARLCLSVGALPGAHLVAFEPLGGDLVLDVGAGAFLAEVLTDGTLTVAVEGGEGDAGGRRWVLEVFGETRQLPGTAGEARVALHPLRVAGRWLG